MDIQKLESIILTDARAEAKLLIEKTRKETEDLFKEQSYHLQNAHKEELEKIKSDYHTKSSSLKTILEADFHKSIAKEKKEKIQELKNKLLQVMLEKVKKNPVWFLDKVFTQIRIQSGNLLISDDLNATFSKDFLDKYLKEKHPGFCFIKFDPSIESGLLIEFNSVRYIFPLQESIDEFVETYADKINSLLFP